MVNKGARGLAGRWNLEHAAGRKMSWVGVGGSLWFMFWLSGCQEREGWERATTAQVKRLAGYSSAGQCLP